MVQLPPWAEVGWPVSIGTLSPSAAHLRRVCITALCGLTSNFDNVLNTFSVHLTPALSLSTPSSALPSPLLPAFSPVWLANTAKQEESSTLAATSILHPVSPTQNIQNVSFEWSTTSTNLSMGDATVKREDGEGEEDLQSMEHSMPPHSYTTPGDLTSVLAHVL